MSKGREMFDNIASVLVFVFGLIGTILFWIFLGKGDVYDNWYPLVGHLVAAHGMLIGIIIYEYMAKTGKSFREMFKRNK